MVDVVMSHVFGPVPSRRLGRSLGVDLVPLKTCTYDCIYCQLGRTTQKTLQWKEWVPLDDVLAELAGKLASRPDYITLSGSGEPTLFSRIGELIDGIKAITDIPVAVLTNGSLLWDKDVRAGLMNADLVIPSLDAGEEVVFQAVNRSHKDISFEKMLGGLVAFRNEFHGEYWLEILLLAGYTAIEAEVVKLAGCAKLIHPDCVQLNTVTRPPSESFAAGISQERMEELAVIFDPPAEVIADFRKVHEEAGFAASREEVLNMLRRRPCTLEDVCDGLGMHRNEVLKYVEQLSSKGLLVRFPQGRRVYYKLAEEGGREQ
ncbi:MAG: radical SAM protein [Phycisphaerae bacterium]|nr:radical SAM protein [Phycisphaerae bacterium]